MKKKPFPIGLTEKQHKHVKKMSGSEPMALYVRRLIDKDIEEQQKKGG